MGKIVLRMILALLLVSAVTSAFNIQLVKAEPKTIIVPDDYPTIQVAVDAASPGDTIIVRDGNYIENVYVNKFLTITSENGSANCTIWSHYPDQHAFNVTANHVTINGFTIKYATGSWRAGVYLFNSNYLNITNNTFFNNYAGILSYNSSYNNIANNIFSSNGYEGIYLFDESSNNTIINNTFFDNSYGVYLSNSVNNIVSKNKVWDNWIGIYLYNESCNNTVLDNIIWNSGEGVYLERDSFNNTIINNKVFNSSRGIFIWDSSSNILSNNIMNGNDENFMVFGAKEKHYIQKIDESNTVDGKPIYYLVGVSGLIIDSSTNAGYIGVVNSFNVTIKDLLLTKNGNGILFFNTSNSRIENVKASNNSFGITLLSSNNNTLVNNNVSNNYDGIVIDSSSNNKLTNNIISNNWHNFGVDGYKLSHFIQDIDLSNKIDNKPIFYWINQKDRKIPNDAGYVGVVNSTNITIRDLILTNNWQGVLLVSTNNSKIINVNASNNWYGIKFVDSCNNTLTSNNISNNRGEGIYLRNSYNNTLTQNNVSNNWNIVIYYDPYRATYEFEFNKIYLNNFIKTYYPGYIYSEGFSFWNSTEKITYTYSGKTYTNYLGNYWSDYTESDTNGDGIGDIPYSIVYSDKDNYPLMEPFENYLLVKPPTCVIKLQKGGVELNEVDVGEFFDIYVGDSTDDRGIKAVRFSSDDLQDGIPTGEWTQFYDWTIPQGDWNAETKIKRWSFATYGPKEVWVELKDISGNTARCNASVFSGWSFAIISDLHIGRGYDDYGGKGTDDSGTRGENYYLTKRLEEVVNLINQNKSSLNIKFLVVLGDISDSGEYSEMEKAKEILDGLKIPYFTVIGNHDVWSKVKGTEEKPIGDLYFQKVFNNTFLNLQLKNLGVEWNNTYDFILNPYYNYAFDYRGKTFLFLDFVNREESPLGIYNARGVLNFLTMRFLEDALKHASNQRNPVIIFTHHPMFDPEKLFPGLWQNISMEVSCIDDDDLKNIEKVFISTNANVKANFAGHVHGFYDPEKNFIPDVWNPIFFDANVNYREYGYTPKDIDVLTTEALMVGLNDPSSEGVIRIVKVKGEEIDFNTIDGKFHALNPYFEAKDPLLNAMLAGLYYTSDLMALMTGKIRVDFETYAFTKIYSTEHPLSYSLNYGDGAAEIKYSSKKELVNFSHYYNINTEKTYNITLTVLGYTPEGKKIIEKISRNITLPNPLLIVARSPVDLTVTDPDGLVVSKQVNEIPGSVYSECDINQDGHLDDLIYISDKKIGDYFIDVVPEPGVELTDIYTLQVWANNITLTLAENVEIKDIPTQPYIVRFTKDKVTAFNYRFEGLKQGTRLYINTNDKTFQFIAPDKEFAVKKADWMQIINLSKSYDLLKYDSKTKSWRVNAFKLALDPSLTSQVSAIQFKEKPKEIILIRHYDQDIWLQAIAIDGKFDFCLALARDMVTKKIYKLFDPPGIE